MRWLKKVLLSFLHRLPLVSFLKLFLFIVDSEAEALASYRLGNAYEEANESETAIKVIELAD